MSIQDRQIYSDPACVKCDGVGMYFPEGGNGVAYCDCHKQQKTRAMIHQSGISAGYIGCTVAGYKAENTNEQKARKAIFEWVAGYKPNTKGFVLIGPPGTGKTHLLSAVCLALIKLHGVQPQYRSATELTAKTKARFGNEMVMPDLFEAAAEARVLALDDFGAEKPSEWSQSLFSELIDSRYRNGKTTLFTSNLAMPEIEDMYGPRIADRMFEMCNVLYCDGRTRRRVSQ